MRSLRALAGATILWVGVTLAQEHDPHETQAAILKRACAASARELAKVERLHAQVRSIYAPDPVFVVRLDAAQTAWTAYWKAQLDALHPTRPEEDAAAAALCRCLSTSQLARERARVLSVWKSGLAEGHACSGSVRVRVPPPQ